MTDLREFTGVLRLSPKEYRVFCSLSMGLWGRELARLHGISIHTLGTYYEQLYNKLNIHGGFPALVRLAVRYDCAGLKRVPVPPRQRHTQFMAVHEESTNPVLPASRNGHRLLAERPETQKL